MHTHTFRTVAGEVAFGPGGEWAKPRLLVRQYQNVNDLDQFRDFISRHLQCRNGFDPLPKLRLRALQIIALLQIEPEIGAISA